MVLDPNIFFPSTGALETYLIFIGLYQFYLRSHLLITQVEFQYNPTRVNSYLPGTGSHMSKLYTIQQYSLLNYRLFQN